MQYDMVCDLIKLKMQMQTPEAITEKMREIFVKAMREGKRLCYFVGKEAVDFSHFDCQADFPIDYLMDFTLGRQQKFYSEIVRNTDLVEG
jgi:hypothetical protein